MRILIDTHILIWHLEGNNLLLPAYRTLISDPENTTLISIASLREIAIKASRGRLSLSHSLDSIVRSIEDSLGQILDIIPEHTVQVSKLPFQHRDPFDRMLIAQAIVEKVPLITADPEFNAYEVDLL